MQFEDLLKLWKVLPGDFMSALGFFTRLPVRLPKNHGHDLSRSAQALPLIGLFLSVVSALILSILTFLSVPAALSALMSVFVVILLTGALHEDGWADLVDGFGGGRNRDAKLKIMKDSRIGTYGVLALVFSIAVKILVLAALLEYGLALACMALVVASVGSRMCLLWMWWQLPNAKSDGLSAMVGQPNSAIVVSAAMQAVLIFIVLMILAGGVIPFVASILLGMFSTWLLCAICRRQIQGQTGDTLGAQQQLAELAILFGFLMSAT